MKVVLRLLSIMRLTRVCNEFFFWEQVTEGHFSVQGRLFSTKHEQT